MQHNSNILSQTHVREMSHMCETRKNVRLCHALCIRPSVPRLPSRRVHDIRQCLQAKSVKKKSTWHERVCSHHSSDQCWSCHSPWCGSCHFADSHHCVEDEDDACDQWDLQLWLCHSRSTRSVSLNGFWRSLSSFGM